jgi:tetratricopeptide (TPR) repeat protein
MERGEFGRALEDLNGALEAIDAVERADANWKARSEAYIRNGRAASYAGLGDFTRALEEFEKSMSLCPENAWAYFHRANAYAHHGDQLNAGENYRLALTKKRVKTYLAKEGARRRNSQRPLTFLRSYSVEFRKPLCAGARNG